jgi:uroporphyrinogen-III synthase
VPELVLITRPEPAASETAELVRAAGLQPVVAPFLVIRSRASRLPAPATLQAVLVASGNAVDALPAAYHALPLLAVGDATAARAQKAGFTAVQSAGGDAPALAAFAEALLDPASGALLLAVGERQSGPLTADLRRRGFRVQRRVVYTATSVGRFPIAAEEAVGDGLRAAMFFSTETARSFARLLPPGLVPALAGADALAIGAPAAAAVRHLPWRAVRVAVRPTQDGVLALL